MAPEAGFEPATRRLTVACSTAELLRNEFVAAGGMGLRRGGFWQSALREARAQSTQERHHGTRGGLGRNRTGIDGFAVRYIATLPPGRAWRAVLYAWAASGVKPRCAKPSFDAIGGSRL